MVHDPFHHDLLLADGRAVPRAAIWSRATTSGGPGGQHANRTASRVEVGVALDDLPLTSEEVVRMREKLGRRVRADGTIAAGSSATRSQHQNREIAEQRLVELIERGLRVDPPRTPTKPSRGARERMREKKVRTSERKARRRWRPRSDES
jgi:ribosome-associated protein